MRPTSAPARRFPAGIIFPKKPRRRPIVNCAIFSLAAIYKKTIVASIGAGRAMLLPLFAFLVRLRLQAKEICGESASDPGIHSGRGSGISRIRGELLCRAKLQDA